MCNSYICTAQMHNHQGWHNKTLKRNPQKIKWKKNEIYRKLFFCHCENKLIWAFNLKSPGLFLLLSVPRYLLCGLASALTSDLPHKRKKSAFVSGEFHGEQHHPLLWVLRRPSEPDSQKNMICQLDASLTFSCHNGLALPAWQHAHARVHTHTHTHSIWQI